MARWAAPHEGEVEPVYPGRCRKKIIEAGKYAAPAGVNWRFRVPDGETVAFDDCGRDRSVSLRAKTSATS